VRSVWFFVRNFGGVREVAGLCKQRVQNPNSHKWSDHAGPPPATWSSALTPGKCPLFAERATSQRSVCAQTLHSADCPSTTFLKSQKKRKQLTALSPIYRRLSSRAHALCPLRFESGRKRRQIMDLKSDIRLRAKTVAQKGKINGCGRCAFRKQKTKGKHVGGKR
jgi:hypothetical protein